MALRTPQIQRFFLAFHAYIIATSPQPHSNPPQPHLTGSSFTHYHRWPQSTQRSGSPTTTPPTPPPRQTYYSLFPKTFKNGPPPTGKFRFRIANLHKEYLYLQRTLRPNRRWGTDKKRAEHTSALLNDAYKTLCDPLLRAQYILSLRGIKIAENDAAKTNDKELLEEVIEARKEIQEAIRGRDVRKLEKKNQGRIQRAVRRVDKAMLADRVEEAKKAMVELEYWYGIREAFKEWQRPDGDKEMIPDKVGWKSIYRVGTRYKDEARPRGPSKHNCDLRASVESQ